MVARCANLVQRATYLMLISPALLRFITLFRTFAEYT